MTLPQYPRDLVGYADSPPHADWPGSNRLAVQFVINYEEGAENSILHGDPASEAYLSEILAEPYPGERHLTMESIYEYGSRVGVWRLLSLFKRHQIPLTIFAVGMAVERNPSVVRHMAELGHEICSHGYRWINYQNMDEATERDHIRKAIRAIEEATGERPLGWFTGRNSINTRRLVVEEGGFVYDADDYNDDLPFWTVVDNEPHLVVPYALDSNDMRFGTPQGFTNGDQFFSYLRDTFDVLYAESATTQRMMSIGLHCRLAGRPGRIAALERFVQYAKGHSDVWFCRRLDIARHWRDRHPFKG